MGHDIMHWGLHDSPADAATDIVNAVLDHVHGVQTDETGPYACVEQHGLAAGAAAAKADYAAGTVASAALSHNVPNAFEQAYADCGVEQHADHGSYSIPTLSNPVLTFLDVVTQPSMANGGEAEYFHARELYDKAIDTGYHQAAHDAFQHQLDERLSIDWSTPAPDTSHEGHGHGSIFDIPAVGFVDSSASSGHSDSGSLGDSGGGGGGGNSSSGSSAGGSSSGGAGL